LNNEEGMAYFEMTIDELNILKGECKEAISNIFTKHTGDLREIATKIKMELEKVPKVSASRKYGGGDVGSDSSDGGGSDVDDKDDSEDSSQGGGGTSTSSKK